MTIRRLIHSDDELLALAEQTGQSPEILERDYLLMAVAAELVESFPGALCFKGGFVLRHHHGFDRISGDIDATRQNPPKHKLDAGEVAEAIENAARRINFKVRVPEPQSNSGTSLDFDNINFRGLVSDSGFVDVEVSYREGVCRTPEDITVGPPFYEPFKIPALVPSEMMAEKLRALAQRLKSSDLGDSGFLILRRAEKLDDETVADIVPVKFAPGLVRDGDHRQRIRDNIERMRPTYETDMQAIANDFPSYDEATAAVRSKLARYLAKL
jgi:predicted nucleotidyltransferase component of viral defense system